MYRYYVSFSYTTPTGPGLAAVDVTRSTPIVNADDLVPIREHFTMQGIKDVLVLSFSAYAEPTTPRSDAACSPSPHPTRRSS